MRDMVFVSHANPEDNRFSLWLSLQLASAGYPVWCDMTQLLGGEDFWRDIEQAIRERTAKFLYVLSRSSNHKEGPRNELRIATIVERNERLRDFIVPLRADDLPFREANIELSRLVAIDFSASWATGLQALLEKLDRDQIVRSPKFSASAVAEWWRSHLSPDEGIITRPETYISNWLPIRLEPNRIGVYTVAASSPLSLHPLPLAELLYPTLVTKRSVISLGEWEDISRSEPLNQHQVASRNYFTTRSFLEADGPKWLGTPIDRQRMLVMLLRLAWEKFAAGKGLVGRPLSERRKAFYFTHGQLATRLIPFHHPLKGKGHRALSGTQTVYRLGEQVKRYWHFGLEMTPRLYPFEAFALKYHVAFSDDGISLWESDLRMHRARHRIGRNWWNTEWSERSLAAVEWLCTPARAFEIPVGRTAVLQVSGRPIMFHSPVSFIEPKGRLGVLFMKEEEDDEDESQDEPEQITLEDET